MRVAHFCNSLWNAQEAEHRVSGSNNRECFILLVGEVFVLPTENPLRDK